MDDFNYDNTQLETVVGDVFPRCSEAPDQREERKAWSQPACELFFYRHKLMRRSAALP